MLTRFRIERFKAFVVAELDLGTQVVFIGPNNCGKTSALQALALWEVGVRALNAVRSGQDHAVINRRSLLAAPVPQASLLWRDMVTEATTENQEPVTIQLTAHGVHEGTEWFCGLAFTFANEESFACRLISSSERQESRDERTETAADAPLLLPTGATRTNLSFLPPMSGLATEEILLQRGGINTRTGEGRTAEVLRSLCHLVWSENRDAWHEVVERIKELFAVSLEDPLRDAASDKVTLAYRDRRGIRLDLSSAGRGLQQTLLLLTHLAANPGTVLLLDEPDAHLEPLRQTQTVRLIVSMAEATGGQVIAASHSEVVLNEVAERGVVVAFLGNQPRRIDGRSHAMQVRKALIQYGFDHYVQAERTGWVLYLEGSTDLALLQAFAKRLGHVAAQAALAAPFLVPVLNQPKLVNEHFHAIRLAKPDLVAVSIFDDFGQSAQVQPPVVLHQWRRRELENYCCQRETLLGWAAAKARQHLGEHLAQDLAAGWVNVMDACIKELETASTTLGRPSPWSAEVKASDDVLAPLIKNFYTRLDLGTLTNKSDYHELVEHVANEAIDSEIIAALDLIADTSAQARPA